MVLATLFWSGAFVGAKYAIGQFPPFSLTFFRFLVALPCIFLLLRWRQPLTWRPRRDQWPALLMLGFFGAFLYHAFFFSSLRYTTAINSSLIGSSLPIVTAVVAALFFGERVSGRQALGIFLSFIGVCLTITGGTLATVSTLVFNRGDLLMLLAVLVWAYYMAASRKTMPRLGITPLSLTAYSFLMCVAASFPLVFFEDPARYLPQTTWQGWAAILYMALLSSVVGYLVQMIAIDRLGTARAAIFVNLVPLFTIAQAAWLLGEPVTVVKLVSAALIISGVLIAMRPAR